MLRKTSQFWESVLFLVDCAAISAAWIGAYWLRTQGWPVELRHAPPVLADYLPPLTLVPVVWWPIFRAFGLFQPRRLGSRASESPMHGPAMQRPFAGSNTAPCVAHTIVRRSSARNSFSHRSRGVPTCGHLFT